MNCLIKTYTDADIYGYDVVLDWDNLMADGLTVYLQLGNGRNGPEVIVDDIEIQMPDVNDLETWSVVLLCSDGEDYVVGFDDVVEAYTV